MSGEERMERALDALFGGEPAGRERRPAAADESAARLAEALLGVAEELRERSGGNLRRAQRLVQRVLARTTRQDPSWRGDVRLALDFLRARLRASPALRLVAASLVLHVLAVPAVAYWMLHQRAPEKRLTLQIEPAREEPFQPEAGPMPPLEDDLHTLARRREDQENERLRERFVLEARGATAPSLELPDDAPIELRLLAARARAWRLEPPSLALAPESLGPLAFALWIELALDRLVLSGVTTPGLAPACQRAAAQAGDPAPTASDAAVRWLLGAAARRAFALGLLEETPAEGATGLLGREWLEALQRAVESRGLGASESWREWWAWAGR